MTKIIIIDAERCVRNSLKESLEHEGYEVEAYANCKEACSQKDEKYEYNLLICDKSTFESVNDSAKWEEIPIIILEEEVTADNAIIYVRSGAFDVLKRKPLDLTHLRESIALATKQSEEPIHSPHRKACKGSRSKSCCIEEPIVGESQKIKLVKSLIEKVAPSEARVLITGANGTGKELVARWLHQNSSRSSAPFIEVNCAAIPSELIESELFGHEKGAFTSAVKQRKGKFEQAQGGTLFMDEIGDMSLSAQAKVLRALQERKVSRVGGEKDVDVDVRIIAATNKNLPEEIRKGTFREDLYHRLSVIVISVPTLAQRNEDIPILSTYFLKKLCNEYAIGLKSITSDALSALQKLPWTGNIRELRNVIERLIILSGDNITKEDVELYTKPNQRQVGI